jgi:hypothetical protein
MGKASPAGTLQTLGSSALAGSLTAAVFYAEYISLGATLGQALPGSNAKALGGVMVVGAVIVCCLFALFLPKPMLAGPRAASLALLIAGMKLAVDQALQPETKLSVALVALLVIVATAACMQLVGLNNKVQAFIKGSNLALRKGFMYATATAIVVGLSAGQLDGCLRLNPVATSVIFLVSVCSALGWTWMCASAAGPWKVLSKFGALSMLVGVAVATAGYYIWIAGTASKRLCATIGSAGFELGYFRQLVPTPSTFQEAWFNLPWFIWPILSLIGVFTGAVMLLESFTTLRDEKFGVESKDWAAYIKCSALVNVLCAPLGLSCSSISASRTTALLEVPGHGRSVVLWHAGGLLFILFALSAWVAKVPSLAVAVALLLVAVQMIDDGMRDDIWRDGLNSKAKTSQVRSTWVFLGILALSLTIGSALRAAGLPFSGGAIGALLLGGFALYILRDRAGSSSR